METVAMKAASRGRSWRSERPLPPENPRVHEQDVGAWSTRRTSAPTHPCHAMGFLYILGAWRS
jgi:hypothetical protein